MNQLDCLDKSIIGVNDNIIDIKTVDSITRLERLEDIEQKKKNWNICCSNSSSEGIKYITQMFLLSSVMVFCFIKLSLTTGDEDKLSYISLLSFILGIILPNPKIKENKD